MLVDKIFLTHPKFQNKNFHMIIRIFLNNEYSLNLIFSTIKKKFHKKFDMLNKMTDAIKIILKNMTKKKKEKNI